MIQQSETVLVTGGTSFVGAHTIIRLLQQGYTVRVTLRSLKRKQDALAMLRAGGWCKSAWRKPICCLRRKVKSRLKFIWT